MAHFHIIFCVINSHLSLYRQKQPGDCANCLFLCFMEKSKLLQISNLKLRSYLAITSSKRKEKSGCIVLRLKASYWRTQSGILQHRPAKCNESEVLPALVGRGKIHFHTLCQLCLSRLCV